MSSSASRTDRTSSAPSTLHLAALPAAPSSEVQDSERPTSKLRADAPPASILRPGARSLRHPGDPTTTVLARPDTWNSSAPSDGSSRPSSGLVARGAEAHPDLRVLGSASFAPPRAVVESRDGGVRLAGGPLLLAGSSQIALHDVEILPPSYSQLHPDVG